MAAALTAHAEGLSCLVVEKGSKFGGTTALSGGAIWVPNNPTLRRLGHDDSRESVLRYLELLTGGTVDPDRLEAYVDHGPQAMGLLERSKWVRFTWMKDYPDYHPELEGGRPRGRSIEAKPINTRKLGEHEKAQRPNSLKGPLGLWITNREYKDLAMAKRTWAGRRASLVAAWRVSSNAVVRRHMATGGRALVARLRLSMNDAGLPLQLRTAMTELVVENGAVTGVVVSSQANGDRRIRAHKGVLLACGGFEHDVAMREEYLPEGAHPDFSSGVPQNTGDGIRAGQQLGAAVDLMHDAWWMPSIRHPAGASVPLVSERAIPCSVIVSGDGKRFTNESSPYVTFVHEQLAGKHVPAWFVMDAKARARYPFAQVLPGMHFSQGFYDTGVIHRADTIEELAQSIGVPADALSATVQRWNAFARNGKDEDFGRGESAYDRYYGDPTLAHPNFDVIDKAPFYGIRVEVGDLGTKGGLVTDEHGRV
ncbi:MAG: FAD-binding protein, partial [Actinomycetota bacterium]|nr:FAD-binding protein [Actinomycetota bacterium]